VEHDENFRPRNFNRPNLLPLTSDVLKLTTHLKDTVAENLAAVKSFEAEDVRITAAFRTLSVLQTCS